MGKAADWLREERRKVLGDWVAVCLGLRYRMRLANGAELCSKTMAPWTTLTEFFERLTNHEARAGNLREEEMRLAAAALLVHAAVIDGERSQAKNGGS